MSNLVQTTRRNGVATLRLHRPEKKNALSVAMYAALGEALHEAEHDDSTRVVLLCGAGENFTAGMASAAFVAYLSSLCSAAFTATQYALFSSLAAVPARFLSAPSGWLVDAVDWTAFFVIATLACVPSLVLLAAMRRHFAAALPRAGPVE